jgi:tRNA G18 (ribose-2'-O)-methylase SpoU
MEQTDDQDDGRAPTAARRPLFVALDNIRSAFNVGSIFRTADACRAARLHLCGMTAYPPHPRLARTALGAEEAVPWTRHAHAAEAFDVLIGEGVPVIAVEVGERAIPYCEYVWPARVALAFGHERRGIAPELLERCEAIVCLPMYGVKNSLNVATAAGVVMYEVLRQWGALATPPSGPVNRFMPP